MDGLNIWIAFAAGFASFISPCCLPLYPSYISYITGISVSRLKEESNTREIRIRTLTHTLFFIIGFSIVFFTLGSVAGVVANTFKAYRDLISQMAAILFIVMGLVLMGIFKPQFLMKERKLQFKFRPAGYVGSTLLGIGFAAGWSPCVGPILGSILGLAASEQGTWLKLITAYTLGFAVPFFILAFFIGSTNWIVKYSKRITQVGGALMVIIGILMYTGYLVKINNWLLQHTPDWLKF
jgi:cytochrome c-type biogenesis protein